jgi:Zn-dependent M28 family amino/carboxypeptidase
MNRLATAALLCAALVGCGGSEGSASGSQPAGFDGERAFDDLAAQVELGPRPSGTAAAHSAAKLIRHGLKEAGARDIKVQRPYANVVATLPGSKKGTVVVGAHYDTKKGIANFVGANDGASGVAVLLELARTLPRPLRGPSVQLVFFDAEEARGNRDFDRDGIRGSRQYVKYAAKGKQGSVPLDETKAMVLFDMIGDCDLSVPREQNSDPRLYRLFAEAGGSASPFGGTTFAVSDDHTPFLEAGIPALDLIDFDYGPGPPPGEYWHTSADTIDKVCASSLDAIGDAALVAIPRIR